MSAAPLGRATGIDAHYILVRDHSAAEVFYTAVVGIQRSREVPRGAEYDLADGSTFGIAAYEDEYHPCGGVMFAVPDVDAAADMVRRRGGKIVLGPMDSPVCRLAWCIDPDGNTFALHRVNNS
jgi:predicted enzyme related to lactoylglutathione lyase